jgi:hypothetical protein
MSLHWRTEEEEVWLTPEGTTGDMGQLPAGRRKRVFILLLLGAAVLLVAYLLRQQMNRATLSVQDEVLAVDGLVHAAAMEQDAELFRAMLSGRDAAWSDLQTVLAEEDLALERAARLLGLEPVPGQRVVADVVLDADLNEAVLQVEQVYRPVAGSNLSQNITLQQTLIYRQGEVGWLLSPPLDKEAFWGSWQAVTERYVTVRYPGRDAELAVRLATDLNSELTALCRRGSLYCASDWHVFIRLERTPASLLRLARQHNVLVGNAELNLPSPSLFGVPVDEAGYTALWQMYTEQVVGLALMRIAEGNAATGDYNHAAFDKAVVMQ